MDICIRALKHKDQLLSLNIDDSFTVDSTLVLSVSNGRIHYEVQEVPPYTKSYITDQDTDETDYAAYINNSDQLIYVAYADSRPAGLMVLRRNWNRYAYIEDIKVDSQFRRFGIGRQLIEKAKSWAKSGGMPGIMLETQSNNLKACRFYESCGFELGGFDFHLYKGVVSGREETALYWYYLFEKESLMAQS